MAVFTHRNGFEDRLKSINKWRIPDSEKQQLKEFIIRYKRGEITGRIGKNSDANLERIIELLRTALKYFKKPISKLSVDDIREFTDALLQNKIKQKSNEKSKPYSIETKRKVLNKFARYLEFRLENNPTKLGSLLKILKVRIDTPEEEVDSLSEDELNKLYKESKTSWERYFHLVMGWGGFRASEFHGILEQDIILPTGNQQFVKIWIRHENSKTKGRKVTLYGKQCLKTVKEYLAIRKRNGLRHDEPVFEKSYDAMKKYLIRIGPEILNRHLHYHLYRHTSATLLSHKLNRQQMCYFYGWKFSSPMPDRYINRQGIIMDDVDDIFEKTEIEDLKTEYDKEIETLKDQVELVIKNNWQLSEAIVKGDKKTIGKLREDMKKSPYLEAEVVG